MYMTQPAPSDNEAKGLSVATWLVLLLAIPTALPLLTVGWLGLVADVSGWPQLLINVLPRLAWTTLLLCAGCALLTVIMGTLMAWLVTMYNFPARPLLKWMALLPLAMPGYIISFAYVDYLAYAGPLQTSLRRLADWQRPEDYMFPEIRSLGGAILVMSFGLYPYVYMSARASFLKQPMNQLHVARTLGRTPWAAFLSITLPQARPALAIGVLLVLMECLNDIGAMSFFGVRTITFAIYSIWLDQDNLGGAAQLALVLLSAIVALIMFEQMARNRDALSKVARTTGLLERQRLHGVQKWLAVLAMFVPVFFGFMLPVVLLVSHAWRRLDQFWSADYISAVGNSMLLAASACFFTVVIALIMAYANRQSGATWLKSLTRISSLGYALPGTVLGIGVLVPFGQLDQFINRVSSAFAGFTPGLIFSGGLFAVVFAYVSRFLIIAVSTVENGMDKIPENLDHVSRTLGRSPLRSFRDIHLPLLRPSLIAAALLVFVDAMKELPATLILRPFDFDTLATQVFTLASLGQLEESAIPALSIVLAGLVPVIILARNMRDPARGRP